MLSCFFSRLRGLVFQSVNLESPPFLAIPGGDLVENATIGEEALKAYFPPYIGTTCNHLCRLWIIVHDMASTYYNSHKGVAAMARTDLDAAQQLYKRLLGWADGLPVAAARSSENPHHVVIAQ